MIRVVHLEEQNNDLSENATFIHLKNKYYCCKSGFKHPRCDSNYLINLDCIVAFPENSIRLLQKNTRDNIPPTAKIYGIEGTYKNAKRSILEISFYIVIQDSSGLAEMILNI